MIEPITWIRQDYCTHCNTDRVLECYDTGRVSINYSMLIDRLETTPELVMEKINKLDLMYIKCRNCGHVYMIDWRREFPTPLRTDIDVNVFVTRQLISNNKQ